MQFRIMTLKFNPVLKLFDDTALHDYLKDKEILSVRDHFFIKSDTPYITLIIQCHESPVDASAHARLGKSDESWKTILKPHELPLFNTLRSWRAERAKKDGIPPYIICTNSQLAEMVSQRPQSLSTRCEAWSPIFRTQTQPCSEGGFLKTGSFWGDGRIRLEPGETGRQLEQQRAELPVGQSQQQQPRQP